MRVLYHITELDVAGAERALYHLVLGMVERGHAVEVSCLIGRGEVGSWLESAGVRVHYLEARMSWPPGFLSRFGRLVARFQPDVLHSFLFHANMVARLIGRLCAVPAVIGSVRCEDAERPLRLHVDGWTQSLIDAETCVSESTRRFTRDASRIDERKLVAIPNAVDLSRFALERGAFRRELGIGDRPLLVAVGRLVEGKGFERLLEAASAPLRACPEALLAIVGRGPLTPMLERRVVAEKLEQQVRFIGWRSDVPQILIDADLMLNGSQSEGMPNVVLEAMAGGCAVISTDVGGCPELVTDQVTGLLVAAGEVAALQRAIARCLGNWPLVVEMGRASRAKVEREHGVQMMCDRNEQLYRRLLAGRV